MNKTQRDDLDRSITGFWGNLREQEQREQEQREQKIASALYDIWDQEQGREPAPRNHKESWDRWRKNFREYGTGDTAVHAILVRFLELNRDCKESPGGYILAGFDCPLCGTRYYIGEEYTVPPAEYCLGCSGNSEQARALFRCFWSMWESWDLGELLKIAQLPLPSRTRDRIDDRINKLESL